MVYGAALSTPEPGTPSRGALDNPGDRAWQVRATGKHSSRCAEWQSVLTLLVRAARWGWRALGSSFPSSPPLPNLDASLMAKILVVDDEPDLEIAATAEVPEEDPLREPSP